MEFFKKIIKTALKIWPQKIQNLVPHDSVKNLLEVKFLLFICLLSFCQKSASPVSQRL